LLKILAADFSNGAKMCLESLEVGDGEI